MKFLNGLPRLLGAASLIILLLIGAPINPARAEQYAANEVIVAYQPQKASSVRQLAQRLGWQVKREMPALKAGVLRVPLGMSPKEAVRDLARQADVRFAEPNYKRFSLEAFAAPNDPGFNDLDSHYGTWYQWDLHRIQAWEGWSIWPGLYYTAATKPLDAVKVAVIDTGVDPEHPDFINDGGVSSDAADGGQIDYDDSANLITGYYGSYPGFDDGYGHGTHVAGVIAASANNGFSVSMGGGGIAGIGYNAQIMALKVLDESGSGTVQDVVNAIIYAADHGARVINLSLGSEDYSRLEQEAVNYAWGKGALVVAAAGNSADATPLYPAGDDRVLAVAATGYDDALAYYSSYGPAVGIAAPGGDVSQGPGIWSSVSGSYEYWQGTSMATPHVAGLAALYIGYRQARDGSYPTPLEVYQAMQRGADDIGSGGNGGWNRYSGYGRINVFATMAELNNREATVGGLTGQICYQDIPRSGLTITATALAGGNKYTAVSRTEGCYRLSNLPAGVYTVTSSISGLTATAANVTVTAGCDAPGVDLDLAVPPDPTGSIVGAVTDQLTGLPVAAALTLRSKNLSKTKRVALVVTSDPETGTFDFGELPVARYTLQAVATGYRNKKIGNITVTADQTTTVDFILKPRKK
jgi:thermitase